ncbi:HNH endonuclease [Planococcus sp. APC 3900]|uniref:HNH endonuclease n=1 Tax=Planococcus sp. APC 3900 TaxID=3035191 RepID=UPI0025B3AA99|nr:HNH endonuclease [Planococcus sp. APC 3900]MDN3439965.1 HNH endonuclease [Planococcus sp. APC 3900]
MMEHYALNRDRLIIGEEYTNNEIVELYKVGNMGGMRRSHKTNSLIIISDHTKMYEDRTEIDLQGREIIHYTGMGKNGDQNLEFAQNKTLSNSNINEVEIVLFERFSKNGGYTFRGPVQLAGTPYQEKQQGEDG